MLTRLFVSHSWDYDYVLQDMEALLNGRGYFPIELTQEEKLLPINSNLAWAIQADIIKKMEKADAVLVISSVFDTHSEWMLWEIGKAKELGLTVIGVVPKGQKRVSQDVGKRTDMIVPWNADSIIGAIHKYSKKTNSSNHYAHTEP